MTFGENLKKLRKERGMSQDDLAERLNTTRQAISKWECDQGLPETDKLRLLGIALDVSVDTILGNGDKHSNDGLGYYVSKEVAEGFIINERKQANLVSYGFFFIILACIPYFVFKEDKNFFILTTIFLGAIGISFIVKAILLDTDNYKRIKQEILVFDSSTIKSINTQYKLKKRKYHNMAVVSIVLIFLGAIPFLLELKFLKSATIMVEFYPLYISLIAVGFFIFIKCASLVESYEILLKNNEYNNKISKRLLKKFKKFID